MRALIVIVLLIAVGIGITAFAVGRLTSSPSPNEEKKEITRTVGPIDLQRGCAALLDWFQSLSSPTDQNTDITVTVEKMKTDRDEFQQQAETRFKAMDVNLAELKAKAKHGRAVTKEEMNEAIDALNTKTEAAREELRALKTAPQKQWHALKARLSASLKELKDGFDTTFSRFMAEWTLGPNGHGFERARIERGRNADYDRDPLQYFHHWWFDLDRDDLRHFDHYDHSWANYYCVHRGELGGKVGD